MLHNPTAHLWLARFAGRLVEHFPNMNPLQAAKRAIAMFPEQSHMDPVAAADAFAADPGAARELVMRGQTDWRRELGNLPPIDPTLFMRQHSPGIDAAAPR